jgi:hypothetical protein
MKHLTICLLTMFMTFNAYSQTTISNVNVKESAFSQGGVWGRDFIITTETAPNPYNDAAREFINLKSRELDLKTQELNRQRQQEISRRLYSVLKAGRESMGVPPKNLPISTNLNAYKYIVIDEIAGAHNGETRRFITKNLEKSDYIIVNLQDPKKTHDFLPEELLENPNLALYARVWTESKFCFRIHFSLYNFKNDLIHYQTDDSCGLMSKAIKGSISSVTGRRHSFDESLVVDAWAIKTQMVSEANSRKSELSKDKAIEEIKKLKELLDQGIITDIEYEEKAKELKKIILDN